MKVTAIFDIGKTNKKVFLFDEGYNEVHHEYAHFEEFPDDDEFPSENLPALVIWVNTVVSDILKDPRYELKCINFSTYGASLVHLDRNGNRATPFYNYLKPMDRSVLEYFFKKYGNRKEFSLSTSSPIMGLLNSGFQLFFLKHFKHGFFARIYHTLHFPQYLSYVFTGKLISEYTSLGCHTALWDFNKKNYHSWVEAESLTSLLPPISPSDQSYEVEMNGHNVSVGIGVHDSSSALIPYIQSSKGPFVLISTGTWSISMNLFNETPLTIEELDNDCLTFLSTKGTPIKASRLFLGRHFINHMELLNDYFNCDNNNYKTIEYNPLFISARKNSNELLFDHALLAPERFGYINNPNEDLSIYDSYEEAYHNLIDELTDLQIASLMLAIGDASIKTIFLDGGFSSNEVFMQMLTNKLPEYDIYSSSFANGTALGAAILVNQEPLPQNYFSNHYQLKLHKPLLYQENNIRKKSHKPKEKIS